MQTTQINQLIRVSNYAKQKGVTRQTVYNWIKEQKVNSRHVDGVFYIVAE